MNGNFYIYRHFDKDDNLLYLGITANPFERLYGHKNSSGWFNEVVKITICNVGKNKLIAYQIESELIEKEQPEYNSKRAIKKFDGEFITFKQLCKIYNLSFSQVKNLDIECHICESTGVKLFKRADLDAWVRGEEDR